jgi:hypothetical protein
LAPLSLQAAMLSSVPMQGGMVMPMISYSSGSGALSVTLDPAVPQLTPLLVSHPADSFDPSDPWFQNLDPSQDGRSFSRRYGFVMDMETDPLPANRAIWIRKLSGPPDLGFYRYRETAPKQWTPIFGTEGSTNALFWSGMMFHPGVSAPPGTNALMAAFEAFLVDTADNNAEVPGTATGPFVFNFTNVEDGRPSLDTHETFALMWPTHATNWVVESAGSCAGAPWQAVTNPPTSTNGFLTIPMDAQSPALFYRLRRVP